VDVVPVLLIFLTIAIFELVKQPLDIILQLNQKVVAEQYFQSMMEYERMVLMLQMLAHHLKD
jgi:hypothetical protein